MKHERWENVLFLHWKVPLHLEKILEENTHPFVLDRFPDENDDTSGKGSYYVGLVLLTEQGVGPAVGRTRWTTVTHHGVNVRTYVQGVAGLRSQQHPPGIHFSSLECNDELTSWGANLFGMPYKVAKIERPSDPKMEKTDQFRLVSKRFESHWPSMLRIVVNVFQGALGRTSSSKGDDSGAATFQVDCSWSLSTKNHNETIPCSDQVTKFAAWAVERYFVYTNKYALNWSGQVEHGRWPLKQVRLDNLRISGVDKYEPSAMRPVLQHMADNTPDSVLFSSGVGPVLFNMLRAV
jgi:uncharacterized protein YqjF (DUF2071 family)